MWFVPSVVACALGGLAFAVVHADERVAWHRSPWVFGGSAAAARIMLTTIAGSLITVAGLTFSVTMIVLQLASSQFSPRVLKNFLRDRFTQLTVGVFIGIFIYCLVGLRSVGGAADFVPRLTVTIASALGVVAVILLLVFIHHISSLIQVSHIVARIARETDAALDRAYPRPFGDAGDAEDAPALLERWRAETPARVAAERSGYVREINLHAIADAVRSDGAWIHVAVAPGDFVSEHRPCIAIWPCGTLFDEAKVRRSIRIDDERDLGQDPSFGVRQLTDIALRAISPGINDPTTAVTCIGYIGALLERLAARALPPRVRRFDGERTVVARRVDHREYVESLAEIGRYAAGDARIVRQLLRTCDAVREAAEQAGSLDLAAVVDEIAEGIGQQGADQARGIRERELIDDLR